MEKEIDHQVDNRLKRQHDEDILAFEQLSISDDEDQHSSHKKMDSDEEHHAWLVGWSAPSCNTYTSLDNCIDDAVYSIRSTLVEHNLDREFLLGLSYVFQILTKYFKKNLNMHVKLK